MSAPARTPDNSEAPAGAELLLQDLLHDQQQLSAVEKFAQYHADTTEPAQARFYRDLLPAQPPGPGQQYAFDVDLDACTGCKACVTACHSLNGLDDNETWRATGLLIGGNEESPIFQVVTTACHHCAHPACMDGCPVQAYEKDLFTGIVKHLDDQCIGCQYCILKCPYDVPKYSAARGIVRKCDMCSSRLSANEAPACVQACPNEAIRITIVDTAAIAARSKSGEFLAGCPESSYTQPTTQYRREKALPGNVVAADDQVLTPEQPHWTLVFMLVFTQLSAGAFVLEALLRIGAGESFGAAYITIATMLGIAGMQGAMLHLGRPVYAFRALLNLKKSWLSREVLAFGLFTAATITAAALAISSDDSATASHQWSTGAAAILALAAVFCSAMIYIDTRRPFWAARFTLVRFFGTVAWLGCSTSLVWATLRHDSALLQGILCTALVLLSSLKLLCELQLLSHLGDGAFTPLRKSALLLTRQLREVTVQRFLLGVVGGVLLPCTLLLHSGPQTTPVAVTALAFSLLSEVLERYLFFRAVVPLKMPGGLPS